MEHKPALEIAVFTLKHVNALICKAQGVMKPLDAKDKSEVASAILWNAREAIQLCLSEEIEL